MGRDSGLWLPETGRNARGYMMRIPAGAVREYRAGVGTSAPAPWSPADDANTVLWMGTRFEGLGADDQIATYTDQMSGGNATQATGSKRFLNKLAIQGGQPGGLADGSDDWYSMTARALAKSHTMFLCAKFGALSGIWLAHPRYNDRYNMMFYLTATTVGYSAHYYGGAGWLVSVAHGMTAGDSAILAIRRSGTTVQFYKNGGQIGTDQSLIGDVDASIDRIGQFNNNNYATGHFFEMTVSDASLSDALMLSFFGYINGIYGVY